MGIENEYCAGINDLVYQTFVEVFDGILVENARRFMEFWKSACVYLLMPETTPAQNSGKFPFVVAIL